MTQKESEAEQFLELIIRPEIDVIGFDTEDFCERKIKNNIALIQLATSEGCLLFRTIVDEFNQKVFRNKVNIR